MIKRFRIKNDIKLGVLHDMIKNHVFLGQEVKKTF